MSTPRKFITVLITASVIMLALIAFVVPAVAQGPSDGPSNGEPPPPPAVEEPPAADQPASEPEIVQQAAAPAPLLTEALQTTWTVTLNPAHVGATNPGFGTGTCPTPPAGQEGWWGWHFITVSNSNFLALSVTFQSAGTFSADPFPGSVFIASPDPSHAYIWTPGPDTLLGGTATVDKDTKQFNLSHVCPGYLQPLTASKTAAGTYDRTVTWTLDKSVDDNNHTGNAGDSFQSVWTVVATKTETLSNYKVTGTITITNPNGVPVGFSVSDVLDDGTVANVWSCPAEVPAYGVVTCSYEATPPGKTATLNTATITSLVPGVDGATATAMVGWTETLIGYDSGTLTDPRFGFEQGISGTFTKTFDETFTCSTDPNDYINGFYKRDLQNVATLNGNIGLWDDAWVYVGCYLPGLEPWKTAKGQWEREVTWELTKSADPTSLSGFAGGSAGSTAWTVVATKNDSGPKNFVVSGNIHVYNPAAIPQTFTVADVLDDGTVASVTCPTLTVAPGATVTCTYEAKPANALATTNTVTVTAPGNAPRTNFEVIEWTEKLIGYDWGTLKDKRFGYEETISATTAKTFNEDFVCPSDVKLYEGDGIYSFTVVNKAELNNNIGLEASAEVTVTCYAPIVTKDAKTSFVRTHLWDIDKSVDTKNGYEHLGYSKVWLYTDGRGDETATWTVDVIYKGYVDSDWKVEGTITVSNPAPMDMVLTSVEDYLDLSAAEISAAVTCPSLTVPAGGKLACTYGANVGGAYDGTNFATATFNGLAFTGTADVKFGDPTKEINKTVNVKDVSDLFGEVALGTATAPKGTTFTYTKGFTFADYKVCGDYTYNNTATIVETGQSASATLKVNVQCYMYETAYAKGNPADCFIPTFKNWGWTNPITPGTYEWPLWAAAAKCDTSKGTLVGTVTVVYGADGYVTVTYNVNPGFKLQETHVYVGYDKYPKVGKRATVAPGAYTNKSPFNGSQVYVIAHAVVGIPDPKFGP